MAKTRQKKTAGLRLPKTVAIGPHKVPVRLKVLPQTDACWGFFGHNNHHYEIAVDNRATAELQLDTFFHEVCHGISDLLGADLSHKQIHALGAGLAQALGPWLKGL